MTRHSIAERTGCPYCGVYAWQGCVTRLGRMAVWSHAARWEEFRARWRGEEFVMELRGEDERFGLSKGDYLLCVDYPWDAKVTVLRRLRDGYDPECNQYVADVKFVAFWKDLSVAEQVGMLRGTG